MQLCSVSCCSPSWAQKYVKKIAKTRRLGELQWHKVHAKFRKYSVIWFKILKGGNPNRERDIKLSFRPTEAKLKQLLLLLYYNCYNYTATRVSILGS
jgi:hypothetical protein